ncbi:MAG TPA: SWIM zinc finger family protein [Streptosporangiaceae bacterium]
MNARWEDWPPPSRPRRVEGGIKARSKRGAIGEQWWSRRFIAVLESQGMSGRLARGRSYARAGQVLDFKLSQGKVTAQVQGSRARPYQVRIGVLPLTSAQWRTVQDSLASQALFRAKLLAGEMPREIEEVFAGCGTPLFPHSPGDLDMRCSCPDWEVPCKHLAAVCYVLAEEFDRDPFAMLAWRGRGRDELLAALRAIQAGPGRQADRDGPAGAAGSAAGTAGRAGLDVPARPLAESLDAFWSPGLSPARLRALSASTGSTTPELLLRMFPPPMVRVRGQDLADVLAPAYRRLAAEPEPGSPADR